MGSGNRILLPLGVFILALTASMALMGYFQKKGPEVVEEEKHPLPEIFTLKLKDQYEKSVTLQEFDSDFKLLFFGNLEGSEVSPIALSKMKEITEYKFRYNLQPIFISLDAGKDSPELIRQTMENYDKKILGFYGNQNDVDGLAKSFGVRMQKTLLPNSRLEYTLDLSPWMYLATPDFRILGAYPTQIRKERLKMEIDAHMKRKLDR